MKSGLGYFYPVVILLSYRNSANLTDGIDGLAAGTSAICVLALGLFLRKYFFRYLNCI
jgi:phospho-N-acetylmuramoyl-pentapeptide-transferase